MYTIQAILPGTTQGPDGRVVRTKNIRFMVGTDGPFTITIPPDKDTPEGIKALLVKYANDVQSIRGL